jgi:hypothetical protein
MRALMAICLFAAAAAPAHAVTADELTKAINDAKLLGPDYKVSVAIQEPMAIVSTYLNRSSQDQDTDCKIDAVFIGKKVFETDNSLARVKVLFYDQLRGTCREVTVTVGDVEAFGSGKLTKDKLLASLEIRPVPGFAQAASAGHSSSAEASATTSGTASQSAANGTDATKQSSPGTPAQASDSTSTPGAANDAAKTDPGTKTGSDASKNASSGSDATKLASAASTSKNAPAKPSKSTTPQMPANANYDFCQEKGLGFYFPKNWVRKQSINNDPDAFVELYCTNSKEDSYIDIKLEDANSVEEQLFYDQQYWKTHSYDMQKDTPTLRIGHQRQFPALSQLCSPKRHNLRDPVMLERHVYFGYAHHIYSLTLWCRDIDYARANTDLNYILATVHWAQPAARTR